MDIAEIRKGIAENPELKTSLLTELEPEFAGHLSGKGYHVRTADEQTVWEKTFEDNKISPRVKEIYGNVEKDILESLGKYGVVKDGNTEKVYDIIKKAPGLIDAKLAEIELKLADALAGKGDDVTKQQLEALKGQVKLLTDEKNQLSSEFSAKEIGWKVKSQFETAFSELAINVPAHIAETDKADYIASKRQQLTTTFSSQYKAKEQDGKIVYVNNEDVIQMKGAELATAKDLLQVVGKYDFTAAKKGGSGGEGGNDAGASDFTTVSDKASLYEAASKKGLISGSEEWTKFVNDGATAKGIKL